MGLCLIEDRWLRGLIWLDLVLDGLRTGGRKERGFPAGSGRLRQAIRPVNAMQRCAKRLVAVDVSDSMWFDLV
jgi:hypothetical protein